MRQSLYEYYLILQEARLSLHQYYLILQDGVRPYAVCLTRTSLRQLARGDSPICAFTTAWLAYTDILYAGGGGGEVGS